MEFYIRHKQKGEHSLYITSRVASLNLSSFYTLWAKIESGKCFYSKNTNLVNSELDVNKVSTLCVKQEWEF